MNSHNSKKKRSLRSKKLKKNKKISRKVDKTVMNGGASPPHGPRPVMSGPPKPITPYQPVAGFRLPGAQAQPQQQMSVPKSVNGTPLPVGQTRQSTYAPMSKSQIDFDKKRSEEYFQKNKPTGPPPGTVEYPIKNPDGTIEIFYKPINAPNPTKEQEKVMLKTRSMEKIKQSILTKSIITGARIKGAEKRVASMEQAIAEAKAQGQSPDQYRFLQNARNSSQDLLKSLAPLSS